MWKKDESYEFEEAGHVASKNQQPNSRHDKGDGIKLEV